MQELRLVAVSEDGTYLVLATAGRGTRFTLPVDDRLRAAVRGHFSRLGQFEIEVESPLRPKEIQARIRSGETAEEIAESAGIPVERVRWFEGPVLQEREYMAQQAQRVAVRRPGETQPGPPLGETVEERLGRGGVDLEEVEWDSWKCEDGTWRIRLSFFESGRPHAAEWSFDPRRRFATPLDEVAARLTSVEWDDDALSDTVTPLVPRRPAMKVVSDSGAPSGMSGRSRGLSGDDHADPARPAEARRAFDPVSFSDDSPRSLDGGPREFPVRPDAPAPLRREEPPARPGRETASRDIAAREAVAREAAILRDTAISQDSDSLAPRRPASGRSFGDRDDFDRDADTGAPRDASVLRASGMLRDSDDPQIAEGRAGTDSRSGSGDRYASEGSRTSEGRRAADGPRDSETWRAADDSGMSEGSSASERTRLSDSSDRAETRTGEESRASDTSRTQESFRASQEERSAEERRTADDSRMSGGSREAEDRSAADDFRTGEDARAAESESAAAGEGSYEREASRSYA
ncbi:septation protein SepH, partial [Spirillospora sp. NPDC049652]